MKNEICSMLQQGVISPASIPTEWSSGIVPVGRNNGRARLCVDTLLNKAVKREIHPMCSVDESLATLGEGRVFTKLDAITGFWKIPLDKDSKPLTLWLVKWCKIHEYIQSHLRDVFISSFRHLAFRKERKLGPNDAQKGCAENVK